MTTTTPTPSRLKLGPKAEYVYKIKLELPAKYSRARSLAVFLEARLRRVPSHLQTGWNHLHRRAEPSPCVRTKFRRRASRTIKPFAAPSVPILASFFPSRTTVAGAPTAPADMKADDLVESGRAAIANNNLPLAVQLLKRATEVDPKNKYAWYVLALAYMGTAPE